MKTFHGDPAIKERYLARVEAHRQADELVKGATGQGGKGCAVWCTLNAYNHEAYEDQLGIPMGIAYLEDEIFENLPLGQALTWPSRFLEAITVGSDLSKVYAQICLWQYWDESLGWAVTAEVKDNSELQKICEDLCSGSWAY